ncbi:VOC family protein [Arthrobacter sp. Marseille-P9274]|uniref:VOC family protein n=1 Tax=Arthrobacter sp. Marseille-P9274 TaxID=2866572 RepID=UPI0021C9A50D|nr:VOC family protein [Arthrobacter sp. Marseille-P9274]
MASRLAVIVIGDVNPPKVADFWCKVLDWRVLEQESGFITIGPPDGAWPSIDVVPVPEGKASKKRLHFDLRAGPGRPGLRLAAEAAAAGEALGDTDQQYDCDHGKNEPKNVRFNDETAWLRLNGLP